MDVARRTILRGGASAALLFGVPQPAVPQSAGRVYRVGCVWAVPAHLAGPYRGSLEQRLRELGWIEGRNIVYEHRFPNDPSEAPALVDEVLKTGVDILVAANNRSVAPARARTSTIPIVMLWGHDPVGEGWAVSLARPGKNVTGLLYATSPGLFAKQLEIVKEIVPKANRVLVIKNADMIRQSEATWEAVQAAARTLGLRLEVGDIRGPSDIERVFDQVGRSRVSAVFGLADALIFAHQSLIAKLAMRQRLPSVFWWPEAVDAGALASYGIDARVAPRDAAAFVDKILRGAKPGELPIEQPATFHLAINLKTAKALGMKIPPTVMLRANHVVE
jgi:putative tryptophan/tyrosine transport system substrate-binding protein